MSLYYCFPAEEYGANAVSCFASVSWPARGAEGARVSKLNGKSSAQKGSPGAEPQTNGGGGKAGHAQAARRVAEENPLGKLQPLDHEGGRSAGGNPGAGGATGARKGSLGEGGGSAGGPAGKRKSGADELAAKSVAKKGRGSLGGGSAKKTPQVEWQPLIGRKVVKKFKGIPFKVGECMFTLVADAGRGRQTLRLLLVFLLCQDCLFLLSLVISWNLAEVSKSQMFIPERTAGNKPCCQHERRLVSLLGSSL